MKVIIAFISSNPDKLDIMQCQLIASGWIVKQVGAERIEVFIHSDYINSLVELGNDLLKYKE